MRNGYKGLREARTFLGKDKVILDHIKGRGEVVYGARAIEARLGGFARNTKDYDVKSRNPQGSSRVLERKLDRYSGQDVYFQRPSEFTKGVYKVIYKGEDRKANTKDDVGIADFSKLNKGFKSDVIRGVRYARLSDIKSDKRRALSSKEFEFRHKKDQEDLDRIDAFERVRRRRRFGFF